MMVNLDTLSRKYDLKITGVIHCGAHWAEEAPDYAAHGIGNVWWVEGNPALVPVVRDNVARYGHHVIEALLYHEDGAEVTLNVTNMDGMSSSILDWGTHPQHAPQCVFVDHRTLPTKTLDTLVDEHGIGGVNLLNMDLQGAEMHALRGATRLLETIDYIFTEVNVDELYADCVRLPTLDAWLWHRGFIRGETCMAENNVGWGDAFYTRWRP